MIPSYFMRTKTSIGRRKNNTVRGRNDEFGYVFKKLAWKCFFPKNMQVALQWIPSVWALLVWDQEIWQETHFFAPASLWNSNSEALLAKDHEVVKVIYFCSPCLVQSLQRSGSTPGTWRSLGVKGQALGKEGLFSDRGFEPRTSEEDALSTPPTPPGRESTIQQ